MKTNLRFIALSLFVLLASVGTALAQEEAEAAGGASGLTVIMLLGGLGMVVVLGGIMLTREEDND